MQIIAIAGESGAGKTTLAKRIQRILAKQNFYCPYAPFAYKVRQIACLLEGADTDYQYTCAGGRDTIVPELGITRRALMAKVTELGFSINKDYWVSDWVHNYISTCTIPLTDKSYLIADDLRYFNTLKYLENLTIPGLTIKVIPIWLIGENTNYSKTSNEHKIWLRSVTISRNVDDEALLNLIIQ